MSRLDRKQFERLGRLTLESARLQAKSEETRAEVEELVREAKALKAPVIHIVDDDQYFVTAITRVVRASGYAVRSYNNSGDFLLAHIGPGPGCLLLDYQMPGLSGLELQKALAARPDPLPIIFLSGHGDVPTSVLAMKSGAMDFLTKPVKRETLLAAVEAALARDAETRATREQARKCRLLAEGLTPREREVFDLVVVGRLNKQIAAELGITLRTVKAHRGQIMTKMQTDSVAQLVHISQVLQNSGPVRNPPGLS